MEDKTLIYAVYEKLTLGKRIEKAFHVYENEKKARIAIFVSDKIYFKTMTLRDKECQHMVIDPSKMMI